MDLSWLISFLFLVIVLSVVFAIIKYFIMPVVPAPFQAVVWAILGIFLLIAVFAYFSGYGGYFHHPYAR